MEWLQKYLGGGTGNLLAGLGGAAAQNQIIKDIEGMGATDLRTVYGDRPPEAASGGLMGEIGRQSTFKPFGVTTPTGARATFGSTGNLDTMLSPTEQALQEQMLGFGTRAFGMLDDPAARAAEQANVIGMLTQDPTQRAAREQEIMGNLTALQAPEQERQRLALEERLFGQGRTGVRTGMFGGTPEQLAFEKAIQEQQAGSALTAMEQARAEQALTSQQTLAGLGETRGRLDLLGQLGLQSIPAAYQGQNQLLANLAPALEEARLRAALQSDALGIGAGLAETGLEAQLGYEGLAAALRQQQFQGLFDLLKGEQAAAAAPAAGGATQLTGNAAIDAAIAMYGGIPRNSGATLTGNDAVDAAISMYGGIPRG
jgi:hypothetical protein